MFQELKKKKIAGHPTLNTLPPILVPAFQSPLPIMIIRVKAEGDYLTLQSLSTLSMSCARKTQKNSGKNSIVTFAIQVEASTKQANLITTYSPLLTEVINTQAALD